jgi:hypothetical protein
MGRKVTTGAAYSASDVAHSDSTSMDDALAVLYGSVTPCTHEQDGWISARVAPQAGGGSSTSSSSPKRDGRRLGVLQYAEREFESGGASTK